MEILAADRGPGATGDDSERCLADGYTTTGDTLGAGLGAVKRMATTFTMRSADGTGAAPLRRRARLTQPDGPAPAGGARVWERSACPPNREES